MYGSANMGLGWSEVPWYWRSLTACLFHEHGRQICFTNTPQDLSAARASGCTRVTRADARSCTTTDGNAGNVWCCPQDRPRPFVTTPEQIARQQEIAAAEARIAAAPPEERAEFPPPAQGPIPISVLQTIRKVGPVAAIAVTAAAVYAGYKYFEGR